MPRIAKGTVVFWANQPVGVPSYLAPPRRSAVRRPVPTRPWYVRVLDSTGRRWVGVIRRCGGVLRYVGIPGPENEEPPSTIFGAERTKNPPISHLLDPKTEEPSHILILPTPPPSTNSHQLLSATLRSGPSARSSTLKIGPKIVIGPLFYLPQNKCLFGNQKICKSIGKQIGG